MEHYLQAAVANLNETIEEFQRKFFGSSSEKPRRENSEEDEPGQEGEKVAVVPEIMDSIPFYCQEMDWLQKGVPRD